MRFKFCGGGDAPEWFLQEAVFLSQISAVRFKLIVLVVYRQLLGAPLDYEKLAKYLSIRRGSEGDAKALVAAVSLILTGHAKYEVSTEELQRELTQVGLPREHGLMLARPLARHAPQLRVRLQSGTLALPRVARLDWRVDLVAARSCARALAPRPEAALSLHTDDGKNTAVTLSHEQLLVLLAETRAALALMAAPK
jgi:hypothetical protein